MEEFEGGDDLESLRERHGEWTQKIVLLQHSQAHSQGQKIDIGSHSGTGLSGQESVQIACHPGPSLPP